MSVNLICKKCKKTYRLKTRVCQSCRSPMKFKLSILILGFSAIFFICFSAWGADKNIRFMEKKPSLLDEYKIEIAYIIQKNWNVPTDRVSVKDNIVSSVAFKVMPDGTIKDITLTEASGNKALDDSALNAVVSSSPLPPHPKSIEVPFIDMRLRFTPYGLK